MNLLTEKRVLQNLMDRHFLQTDISIAIDWGMPTLFHSSVGKLPFFMLISILAAYNLRLGLLNHVESPF